MLLSSEVSLICFSRSVRLLVLDSSSALLDCGLMGESMNEDEKVVSSV